MTALRRVVVDRAGMAAPFLRDLQAQGYTVITLLRTDQYEDLESFSEVGPFVPLELDQHGRVLREVAPARFALPVPDQPGQFLPLGVALIRDWRRQVPTHTPEEQEEEERWMRWREGWTAQPAPATPTTAKLVPIVTTAPCVDAVELAQTYIRRWPVQENIIRDFLVPLGLEIVRSQMTKTGVFATGRSRDHVADLYFFSGDNHTINEEFDELPFLFEAGLL